MSDLNACYDCGNLVISGSITTTTGNIFKPGQITKCYCSKCLAKKEKKREAELKANAKKKVTK